MNLQEYIQCLKSCVALHPPDLDNEDSILGLLYEAHSESNAMLLPSNIAFAVWASNPSLRNIQ